MKGLHEADTDRLIQLLRHRHAFAELREEPLGRRELQERLGVSRATSHRYVRTLEELSLIEKRERQFALTDLGEEIAASVGTFEATAVPRLRLSPVFEVTKDVTPPLEIDAFVHATVTSAEEGDPFAPLTRFVSLVQETNTLCGINTCRIAPTYMEEFRDRILGGMKTELIDLPELNRDIMQRYPEKCVQVCVSEHLTLWVHDEKDSLPFGLVLLDHRVGIGLFERSTGTLQQFVDTDDPTAREWAATVYEEYKADSVRLENFTVTGLREAVAQF